MLGEILSLLTHCLLTTEQEAPESNNNLMIVNFVSSVCRNVLYCANTHYCRAQLAGLGALLAISLLLVPAVVCRMSPVPTLEASYCSWWSSSCSTISCHMA